VLRHEPATFTLFLLFAGFCSGEPYPGFWAQRAGGVEDLLSLTRGCGEVPRFASCVLFFHVVHIPLRGEGRKPRLNK